MPLSGFSSLQTVESRLVAAALSAAAGPETWDSRRDWLLELSPAVAPSPALPKGFKRHRVLFDHQGCVWPFRSRLDEWPLDNDSVPAVVLRHVWQPGLTADAMSEAVRVLRPGGWLMSISANPWHYRSWQVLGRDAFWLPSWPRWQWLHARHGLELSVPVASQWRGAVPGLTPVLLLIGRKPRGQGRVVKVSFNQRAERRMALGTLPAANCRAA